MIFLVIRCQSRTSHDARMIFLVVIYPAKSVRTREIGNDEVSSCANDISCGNLSREKGVYAREIGNDEVSSCANSILCGNLSREKCSYVRVVWSMTSTMYHKEYKSRAMGQRDTIISDFARVRTLFARRTKYDFDFERMIFFVVIYLAKKYLCAQDSKYARDLYFLR